MDDRKQTLPGRDLLFIERGGKSWFLLPKSRPNSRSWIRWIMKGSGNSCWFQIVE
jgi:hypothetical protein